MGITTDNALPTEMESKAMTPAQCQHHGQYACQHKETKKITAGFVLQSLLPTTDISQEAWI